MASTNKTPNYGLNQWLGTDYMKREDWNNDNSIIDTKLKSIFDTLNLKAPLVSPIFTGAPIAPTAAAGTNTDQVATTSFVNTAVKNGLQTAHTYAELAAMVAAGTLMPGGQYVLSDYATKYQQPDTLTIKTMTVERLVLTAISGNKFDLVCSSLDYPQDIIHYRFDLNKCEDGTTPRNGFITRRIDESPGINIDAPLDWRKILWARYLPNQTQYLVGTTLTNYSVWTSGNADVNVIYKSGNTLYRALSPTTPSSATDASVFGVLYADITKGMLLSDLKVGNNGTSDLFLQKSTSYGEYPTFGTGCSRITIAQATYGTYGANFYMPNNVFGSGCSAITFGSNCYNNTIGDTTSNITFASNCLNNTIMDLCGSTSMASTCSSNVLLRNTSANFGTSCSNNIIGINSGNNTFGLGCNGIILANSCTNNFFSSQCSLVAQRGFVNNFLGCGSGGKFGYACTNNNIGSGCYSLNFGDNCSCNTLMTNCYSNSLGNNCQSNTFGSSCYSNNLGANCSDNTIDSNSSYNVFGSGCNWNMLGSNNYTNTFGIGCGNISMASSCHDNTFGTNCSHDTIGSNCYSNNFGNGFNNNVLGSSIMSNIFGNNKTNLIIHYMRGKNISAVTALEGLDYTTHIEKKNDTATISWSYSTSNPPVVTQSVIA